MPSIFTLEGASSKSSRQGEKCKCVYNKRTGKSTKLCFVGKGTRSTKADGTLGKPSRSGWVFVKSTDCKKSKP